MFTILKLIKPFFLPPTLVLLGMVFCLWLLFRKRWMWGKIILAAIIVIYYLLSTGPVNHLLVRSLERATPVFLEKTSGGGEPEAIIILAGGAWQSGPLRPRDELSGPSWRRLWRGIELYGEKGGRIPILYSGGSGDIFNQTPIEGRLTRGYALTAGIPESDFLIETHSRNTYENIRESKKLLDREFPGSEQHHVILVTSSIHMPRAVLIAQKAGLIPIPEPADFLVRSPGFNILDFIPSADTFLASTRCLNEWVGIVAYRIMGRL
ncbi:MAG: YdcF family protein [Candidatus Auribacterota bacterium]|nr:YdcF family protein [Candidatus Auribacterota bacterium]